jgi:hypothetical protein
MSWLARSRLEHELGLWRKAGQTPRLWWRDDDARQPTPALDRLLQSAKGAPIALAVIPDGDLPALARRLAPAPNVTVAQHGVDHTNRLPEGGRRSEYAAGTPQAEIDAAVSAKRDAMRAAGLSPAFFTPPWNEFDDALVAAVARAGYAAFSAGMYGKPMGGLSHIAADVDVLRWKGDPHFKGEARILNLLRRRLEARRKAGQFSLAVGVLTHHLVHDEATWGFLEWFVGWASQRFRWTSFAEASAA